MAGQSSAILVAEVGHANTTLLLVDLVDGDFRLIARAETASPIAEPAADLTHAIVELATTVEEITGRRLVSGGQLLIPPDDQGNGAGIFVVTTSAAPPLRVAVAALAGNQSAQQAVNAARGTYSSVEHVFALDTAGAGDQRWLGMQVARLVASKPEVFLIAGGLEGGATSPLERIGHIVGLIARHVESNPHIIYAGNSAAVEGVRAALGEGIDLEVVENLRPSAQVNRLEPTRSAIRRVYHASHLPRLPGYDKLERWGVPNVGTAVEDQAVAVRFLAERFGRNILALDIGANNCTGLMQAEERFSQTILAGMGLGGGAVPLLGATTAEAIIRWLPFELSPDDLRNRLLNRLLRPPHVAIDLDELLLDHAILREAVRVTLAGLVQSRPTMHFDLVLAGGAIARAPRPGLAALTLLDTLPLDNEDNQYAIELYLDSLRLLASTGALARVNADAAVGVIEQDALNNGPLATVIVPRGTLQEGSQILEVELRVVGGDTQQVNVLGGQLVRLPLPRGKRAAVRIRPAQGIYIGNNPPGAEVLSDEAAISGSALGVVIDARPRPLRLPDEQDERSRTLLAWLRALDAIPPVSAPPPAAIPQAAVAPTTPTPASTTAANGETSLLEDEDRSATEAPASPSVISAAVVDQDRADTGSDPNMDPRALDLQAMRADLVEPAKPRRGFFRRRS